MSNIHMYKYSFRSTHCLGILVFVYVHQDIRGDRDGHIDQGAVSIEDRQRNNE